MGIMQQPQIRIAVQKYQQMEAREQLAVKLLAVFFAALALYFLFWAPANNFYEESREDYERNLSLLQYMKATEQQARAAGSMSVSLGGQNLMSDISNSAQRFGIKPNRLAPEGADGVSVWFDGVSFPDLMRWVHSLGQQGVSVKQVSIDREEQSGIVNARIILRG